MSETHIEKRSDTELVITRTFRGPRHLVFEAYTSPEHVRRWWVPRSRGVEPVSIEGDVRVGGTYRYVIRAHGNEVAFSGRYLEVDRPARLVFTQVFEPMAEGGAAMVTIDFEEAENGHTRLVAREVYPSAEALEGAIAAGMFEGLREVFDQLDELVASFA